MNFKIDKTPHSIPIAGLSVSMCVSQSCDTFDAHSCLVKEEEEMKEEEEDDDDHDEDDFNDDDDDVSWAITPPQIT